MTDSQNTFNPEGTENDKITQTSETEASTSEKIEAQLSDLGKTLKDIQMSDSNRKCEKDPEIVPFSVDSGMAWVPWRAYFESLCVENNKTEVWMIRNVQRYLKDKALTLYINNCLQILHWSELTALFNEHFSLPGEPSLTDFTNVRFKYGENINEYYQIKVKLGRDLGLENKFLLEGLTEGLPLDLRRLVITNAPKTLNEWRELVFKLSKLQPSWRISENKSERIFQPNFQEHQQWRPQRPIINSSNSQPRPWSYRNPFQNPQPRPNSSGNNNLSQRFSRPQTAQFRPNAHYQDVLPPSPCNVCLNIGIPNAYHWVQVCPFRQQRLDPQQIQFNQNPNLVESQNTSQAGDESAHGNF